MGGQQRGRLTSFPVRNDYITMIQAACTSGARLMSACDVMNISVRTYRRWFHEGAVRRDQRPLTPRPASANQLTQEERETIISVCNQVEYAHLPPTQIVPLLLDKGVYYGSESSYYRVLKAAKQINHRGRGKSPNRRSKPSSYKATKPNEVWSWDITYLPSLVKGQYYYLYLFEDIYSRKIVGYEVHHEESGESAAQLLQRCMLREQCFNQTPSLVLHSDNGAPMKSQTLKAKMEELQVASSYNRPRVSNDNPYSESLFKTLKYSSGWPPTGFSSLADARDWVQDFVDWYNGQHKHSQLNYVSPGERHDGLDGAILKNRALVLEAAREKHPSRWSGSIRNCNPIGPVMLNPDRPEKEVTEIAD